MGTVRNPVKKSAYGKSESGDLAEGIYMSINESNGDGRISVSGYSWSLSFPNRAEAVTQIREILKAERSKYSRAIAALDRLAKETI
jgi:hypothetical protein